MYIDSIQNGYVIDHIEAGKSLQLLHLLGLDKLDCPVAIIRNVPSKKHGKKDIIKIDGKFKIDFNIIGYISPNATINRIENGELLEKEHVKLPEKLVNILKCKNPRCITTTEQEIEHVFILTDENSKEYRCADCDTQAPEHIN